MIDNFKFGEIIISGETYRSDVIVYPEHVNANWWRKQSHKLDIDDIKDVIGAKPDIIIIGTGQPGLMTVDDKTVNHLSKLGIKAVILPTDKACQEYNRIEDKKKVIACLHLTC